MKNKNSQNSLIADTSPTKPLGLKEKVQVTGILKTLSSLPNPVQIRLKIKQVWQLSY